MKKRTFQEINSEYDLELDRVTSEIKKIKKKSPRVLLQFPDGLKPWATTIVDELEKRVKNVQFFIWLGSCFGACDLPSLPKEAKIDLLVHFGHSAWKN